MRSEIPQAHQERIQAVYDLLRRTGAKSVSLRYQDDDTPTAWVAVASFKDNRHEAAGALDPLRALLRLCEILIDGGFCVHCQRPAGFEPDSIDSMPLNDHVCWYQWDPELKTFRRGCE